MIAFQTIQNKILAPDTLAQTLAVWRFKNYKIVFTNGCFDILHRGHVEYLAKAASFGDKLILGLNTDESIRALKGPDRPIQDEQSRALIMASLACISAVVLFNEDTPYNLIKTVQPDVLVKGADYKPEAIVGYDIVMQKGGSVETISFVEGHSTTGIVNKLKPPH